MKTARTLSGIEYFRLAAAFLVVAIHCSPLTTYSETADFILTRAVARVAVPFFFMVTGFFVLGRPEKLRRFLKRTALLYLACILLYLPLNLYSGALSGLTPVGALRELLFEGTFYHLWYFPAVLLGAAYSLAANAHSRGPRHRGSALRVGPARGQLLGPYKRRTVAFGRLRGHLRSRGLYAQRAVFRPALPAARREAARARGFRQGRGGGTGRGHRAHALRGAPPAASGLAEA